MFRSYLNRILHNFAYVGRHRKFPLSTAKVHYGKSLANVDWLHGGAESLLMLTNLFIVVGLRKALREAEHETTDVTSNVKDEEKSSV